jgi:hypothetical protein
MLREVLALNLRIRRVHGGKVHSASMASTDVAPSSIIYPHSKVLAAPATFLTSSEIWTEGYCIHCRVESLGRSFILPMRFSSVQGQTDNHVAPSHRGT